MLRELISVLKGGRESTAIGADFDAMLAEAVGMALEASAAFWARTMTAEARTALYKRDVRVNKLERAVRKRIVAHLAAAPTVDVPYCLTIFSLAKDVERLGDYAKNLADVTEFDDAGLPTDDPLVQELGEIRSSVEALVRSVEGVLDNADRNRAEELTREGRMNAQRCETLVRKLAMTDHAANLVVTLTLAARYYKRLQGHALNLVSSVLMPVHKLDYFDETLLPGTGGDGEDGP